MTRKLTPGELSKHLRWLGPEARKAIEEHVSAIEDECVVLRVKNEQLLERFYSVRTVAVMN